MRPGVVALSLLVLLPAAACSQGGSSGAGGAGGPGGTPAPAASATAAPAGLTQDACRVLTAADVRAALGIAVTQLPLTSPPPGGGPDASLVSGCTYASATAAPGGVSLALYRDMPIDYFANVPGVQRVAGVGDAAFEEGPMLLGRKGKITFQLTVEPGSDPSRARPALLALAHAVASRL